MPSDPASPLSGTPNRCSPKDTYKNIHNSTIYKSQTLETIQMSIKTRMEKQLGYTVQPSERMALNYMQRYTYRTDEERRVHTV